MRLLSRKIYRAFPELDRFSDGLCELYIDEARSANGANWHRLMITLSLPASFIAWILLLNVLSHLPYNPKWGPAVSFDGYSVSLIEVVEMVVGAGVLWFPYLMACLLRDYFLHRTLRNKLVGCKCPNCSYSLLGLQTIGLRYGRGVQCPECGHEVYFQTSHIREEDLNPVSLTEP